VQVSVQEYLQDIPDNISFQEFASILNNLWNVHSFNKEKDQEESILKIKSTIMRLWNFLDYENKGFLTKKELQQGVSYVMGSDLTKQDIDFIWEKADQDNDNKLNFKEFSLSVFNRVLFSSYAKNKGTNTFLSND
jgi:Ca2+-binding EF-hand superfamily protein